MGEKLAPSQ